MKQKKYLRLGQTECKLLALRDISKECGKGKFYKRNLVAKEYLLKELLQLDNSYIQI